MTASSPNRLPRAFAAVLLGLLLAFNAVTAALHPALPGTGGTEITKLTARAPIGAQFREPAAVTKLAAGRSTARHDDHDAGDAGLPPMQVALRAPATYRVAHARADPIGAPGGAARAYRARAPPFAA